MSFSQTGAWDTFIKILAAGELAAADECSKRAKEFAVAGDLHRSRMFENIREEELKHFKFLRGLTRRNTEIPQEIKAMFRGACLTSNASVLEHLILTHIVFESCALGYMGSLLKHLNELDLDPPFKQIARSAFSEILRDEVEHVFLGGECIREFSTSLSPSQKETLRRSVERHVTLILSVPELFSAHAKDFGEVPCLIKAMKSEFIKQLKLKAEKANVDFVAVGL